MHQLLERIAPVSSPFLTAQWRNLALLSWPIERAALAPRVPAGTELDLWNGQALVSVVGFRFLRAKLLGVGVPGHTDFEEVNLRFYVKRSGPEGWRHGVVFLQEIVPLRAVAWAARALYGEQYVAWPMTHRLEPDPDGRVRRASYTWRRGERDERVEVAAPAPPALLQPGTLEAFVTERGWGYTALKDGGTLEYRVEHPAWRVSRAESALLDCDAVSLWGAEVGGAVLGQPLSALLADGSPVAVYRGAKIQE
jgi:uncharacterized protein YqjF (DUF2071 family)